MQERRRALELFRQRVAKAGYVVVDDELQAVETDGYRFAFPLDEMRGDVKVGAIHRNFAELKSDEDMRTFASEWGMLNIDRPEKMEPMQWAEKHLSPAGELQPFSVQDYEGGPVRTEEAIPMMLKPPRDRLEGWRIQIRRMRFAVDLVDSARNENLTSLKKWVKPGSDRKSAQYYREDSPGVGIAMSITPDEPLFEFVKGQPKRDDFDFFPRAALVFAKRFSDTELKEHTFARILLHPRDLKAKRTANQKDQFEIRLTARNLVGALWLSFARELCGDRAYLKCPQCRQWFLQGHAAKELCSRRCVNAAHEARKRKAQDMAAQGANLKTIASELEADDETVRGWVKEPGRRARLMRELRARRAAESKGRVR